MEIQAQTMSSAPRREPWNKGMNECSAISDLPASTPSMKSTSHFGGNDGDEPGSRIG